MTKLEEVTRAICNPRLCNFPQCYCERAHRTQRQARAVVEAMREPTEEMIDAGNNAKPIPSMRAPRDHYRLAYQAMINEILKG